MAKRRTPPAPPPELPHIVGSRDKASKNIQDRIAIGRTLRDRDVHTPDQLDKAEADWRKWKEYNCELLKRMFSNQSIAAEYERCIRTFGFMFGGTPTFAEKVQDLMNWLDQHVEFLESLTERLQLIPEATAGGISFSESQAQVMTSQSRDVFIVHGHDEAAKETVARLLHKLEVNPIILHEQPNRGRTIIEKFEGHSRVGFAVILLTPDDVGYAANNPEKQKPRARQNVILEFGYFLGHLGRDHVCALYKGGVELPSDIDGVVYVSMDSGNWQFELAREIKSAGLEVDMNKLT